MRPKRLAFFAIAGALAFVACNRKAPPAPDPAPVASTPAPRLSSVVVEHVPHVRQKPDFCGEAAVASWLKALGQPVDQDDVFDVSGMDPSRGMGVTTRELKTALERLGFRTGPVWNTVNVASAESEIDEQFRELHADLARGIPSIICTRYDESPNTTEHFRLVLGYDAASDSVIYHEPAEDDGAYRRMPRARFESLWPLKYEHERWTVIRLRLEPGSITKPSPPHGFPPVGDHEARRPAEFAQHVIKLRERLPPGMSVVIEPPFVVIGDGGRPAVERAAANTVRWAVTHLEKDFFAHSPKRILDIWLFKDAESYQKHTKSLFGETPSTPYGFYSREHNALIMNISTGGGTLVHEIVHPYMEANFPNCPAWFNEGLGSLFEQSAERDGHIIGLPNWRLPGLQRAIREQRAPAFETLLRTSSDEFYSDDSGVHYAEARYLLYYLQERGLLRTYAERFLANRERDRSGYDTLTDVLGHPNMKSSRGEWEKFVLGLHFP